MHRGHPARAEVGAGGDGLLRVAVDVPQPPARGVGADGHEGEVDAGVAAADLGEPVAVAGVAREVHLAALRVGEHPAAPQGAAGVEEAAPRPVVGGDEVEGDAADLAPLPPVQLVDAGEAAAPEPAPEPGRDQDRGGARQAAQGRGVQVVVVVVADDDGVDGREGGPGDADRGDARRRAEDAVGPDGVGEHGEAADPQDPAGMPGPGEGEDAGSRRGQRRGRRGQQRDVAPGLRAGAQGAGLAGQPGHGADAGEGAVRRSR